MIAINKKIIFLFLVLLISVTYASQETDWLLQEYNKRPRDFEETSLSILALKKQLGTASSLSAESEKLKEYLEACAVANNCNNRDAAFIVWALKESGDNSATLDKAVNWLINSRTMFTSEYDPNADWLIQAVSNSAGSCIVNNTESQQQRSFNVQQGYTPWENVNALITQNTKELIIDCQSLQSVDSISLIKRITISGIVNYFIKEEVKNDKVVELQLGIPCWGPTYRSTCNQEITSIVLLALFKNGKSPDPAWLQQQQLLTPLQASILYRITNNNQYLSSLESSQAQAGYWQPIDIETTSLVYSFIPADSAQAKRALAWIQGQKAEEGCWPKPLNLCNLKSTASTLYALGASTNATSASSPAAGNATSNATATPAPSRIGLDDCDAPCLDNQGCVCQSECKNRLIEKGDNCGGPEDTTDDSRLGELCFTISGCEGQYDSFGRCQDIQGDNCPAEDIADDLEEEAATADTKEDADSKTTGKEEGSSALFWLLMVIAALMALVGGSYIAWKKGLIKFKKKATPEYQPRMKLPREFHQEAYQPRMKQKKHPVQKFLDKELDKSIEDLEKLLKS